MQSEYVDADMSNLTKQQIEELKNAQKDKEFSEIVDRELNSDNIEKSTIVDDKESKQVEKSVDFNSSANEYSLEIDEELLRKQLLEDNDSEIISEIPQLPHKVNKQKKEKNNTLKMLKEPLLIGILFVLFTLPITQKFMRKLIPSYLLQNVPTLAIFIIGLICGLLFTISKELI